MCIPAADYSLVFVGRKSNIYLLFVFTYSFSSNILLADIEYTYDISNSRKKLATVMLNHYHICPCVCRGWILLFNDKKIISDTEDGRRCCLQWDMALSIVTPACARDKVHRRRRITRAE